VKNATQIFQRSYFVCNDVAHSAIENKRIVSWLLF